MRAWKIIWCCWLLQSGVALAQNTNNAVSTEPGSLAHFMSWFVGEYSNHEQVWQQKQDAEKTATGIPADPFLNMHHLFAPVTINALGPNLVFVRQRRADEPNKILRQRLYRFSQSGAQSIKLEIFSFVDEDKYRDLHLKPELQNALTNKAITATPGCDVLWRYDVALSAYLGSMPKDVCKIDSKMFKKTVLVNDDLRLTASEIWINDQARDSKGARVWGRADQQPNKNRKLRYFSGWAYINRDGIKATKLSNKFSAQRNILMHNEGQRVPLLFDNGKATGYAIELAQLTYQETGVPILKLALIDEQTGKSLSYIWSDTTATRIGMNLQWLQVGLTVKPAASAFGFDLPVLK